MFDRIFGNYLLERRKLTAEQLEDVFASQEMNRVRLGVIAISEKLMSIEQAEEINKLQAIMDKRFGDIAIENGYLTQQQVKHLLSLQGNIYLIFIQTLIDKEYLSMEEITQCLNEYQYNNGFTLTDMDALKSGDVDRITPVFLANENLFLQELVSLTVRTASRLIDYHIFIGQPYKTDEYFSKQMGVQRQEGDFNIFTGIAADHESIMQAAIAYAGERFVSDQEEALDAVCEYLNCVNGLFATMAGNRQIEIDMLAPEYYMGGVALKGEDMFVIPMHICGTVMDYVVCVDAEIEMN